MFIDVEVISSRLNNIDLESFHSQGTMRPNTEKPPTCGSNKLPPVLHLTPSTNIQRRDGSPLQGPDNPCLLKPQHDIPPTPPPQTDPKPTNFFPQKIG